MGRMVVLVVALDGILTGHRERVQSVRGMLVVGLPPLTRAVGAAERVQLVQML